MQRAGIDLSFAPIHKTTLVEMVMEQIINLMREGRLKPGDRLPSERTLMKMMNVGRSTVREALQALAALNLVETRSGHGSVVKSLPPALFNTQAGSNIAAELEKEMRMQLLEMREIIEIAVSGWAVERATDEDIAQVKKHLDEYLEQAQANDRGYKLESHLAFHRALAQASHNEAAARVVEYLVSTFPASLSVKYSKFLPQQMRIHQRIFATLAARDGEGLRAALTDHMNAERQQIGAESRLSPGTAGTNE